LKNPKTKLRTTIYAWKEDSIPTNIYNWHIGGRRKDAIDLVERLTGMQATSFSS